MKGQHARTPIRDFKNRVLHRRYLGRHVRGGIREPWALLSAGVLIASLALLVAGTDEEPSPVAATHELNVLALEKQKHERVASSRDTLNLFEAAAVAAESERIGRERQKSVEKLSRILAERAEIRKIEEAKARAEEEARLKAEEEARLAAEEEARIKAEVQAKAEAEAEAKKAAEAKRKQWVKPVAGDYRVSSEYGMRTNPVTGEYNLHGGIDLAASTGTPVVAAGPGEITWAGGTEGGYGNRVVVTHPGGTETWYAHLSSITRSSGEVLPGDEIGKVGETGNATGPHLHLEVRPDGADPIDPRPYLAERGVHL